MAQGLVAMEGGLMQYVAFFQGREVACEIEEIAPDRFRILLDGREIEVTAREASPSTMLLFLNNRVAQVEFETNPEGGERLMLDGHVADFELLDLRQRRLRMSEEHEEGTEDTGQIMSPMAGKVVACLVAQGDKVEKGDGVVVVEAMKMENELKAPRAGVVKTSMRWTSCSNKRKTACESGS